jgi:hypothetical protein
MQSNVTPRDSRIATRGNATRTKGIQESKNHKNFSHSLCQTTIRASFFPAPSRASAPDSRGTAKTIQMSAHAIDQGQYDKCDAARSLSRLWSLEPAEAAAVMFSVHKI